MEFTLEQEYIWIFSRDSVVYALSLYVLQCCLHCSISICVILSNILILYFNTFIALEGFFLVIESMFHSSYAISL